MALTAAQLEFCRSLAGEGLLASPLPADRLAAVTALRKVCAPDEAAAVMEVREVRRRAAASGKFPPHWAARLLGTATLLQQASSVRLALYVGRRLAAAAAGGAVWDLCCGLGANALGLAAAGATVRGVDRTEQAVLCARHNAVIAGVIDRCTFTVADATAVDLARDAIVHIDPDRRPGGARTASLAGCDPPEPFLAALPERTRAGAIKLSPALAADAVADWPGVRTEYISEHGVCRQLLASWGSDQAPNRQATVVFGDALAPRAASLPAGAAETRAVGEPGRWILEPDPAVSAAGAADDLAALLTDGGTPAWRIGADIDWLSADEPVETPFARCFRILRTVPGREADIAAAVGELNGGLVEIKPRGVRLDTDTLQHRLRGRGDRPLAVLWCRIGRAQQAYVTARWDSEKQ